MDEDIDFGTGVCTEVILSVCLQIPVHLSILKPFHLDCLSSSKGSDQPPIPLSSCKYVFNSFNARSKTCHFKEPTGWEKKKTAKEAGHPGVCSATVVTGPHGAGREIKHEAGPQGGRLGQGDHQSP